MLPPRSSPRRLGGSSVLSLPASLPPVLPSSLRPLSPYSYLVSFPLHPHPPPSPYPPPSATLLHFLPPLPLLLSSLFPLHPHPPFAPQHPQHFSTSCPLSLCSYLAPFRSIHTLLPPLTLHRPQHSSTSRPLSLRSYLVPFRSIASFPSPPFPSTVRNTSSLPALSPPALI